MCWAEWVSLSGNSLWLIGCYFWFLLNFRRISIGSNSPTATKRKPLYNGLPLPSTNRKKIKAEVKKQEIYHFTRSPQHTQLTLTLFLIFIQQKFSFWREPKSPSSSQTIHNTVNFYYQHSKSIYIHTYIRKGKKRRWTGEKGKFQILFHSFQDLLVGSFILLLYS